jgi:hypothetical protein
MENNKQTLNPYVKSFEPRSTINKLNPDVKSFEPRSTISELNPDVKSFEPRSTISELNPDVKSFEPQSTISELNPDAKSFEPTPIVTTNIEYKNAYSLFDIFNINQIFDLFENEKYEYNFSNIQMILYNVSLENNINDRILLWNNAPLFTCTKNTECSLYLNFIDSLDSDIKIHLSFHSRRNDGKKIMYSGKIINGTFIHIKMTFRGIDKKYAYTLKYSQEKKVIYFIEKYDYDKVPIKIYADIIIKTMEQFINKAIQMNNLIINDFNPEMLDESTYIENLKLKNYISSQNKYLKKYLKYKKKYLDLKYI